MAAAAQLLEEEEWMQEEERQRQAEEAELREQLEVAGLEKGQIDSELSETDKKTDWSKYIIYLNYNIIHIKQSNFQLYLAIVRVCK